ncbi:hypothetical protein [Ralstonia phage RP12]|uniref:GIY-YIG domain-containing protein n=1 Tax=Ralstonia phage RP12 TaxID=1923889 RepID=A0A1L7N0N9_9CAUD|nr:hypothetical protein FDH28_gp054 [Ralstonia phage RP12]BAW19028.1 hypothetical protein [Ralstonia phage RP12]
MIHNRSTDETYFGSGVLGDRLKVHSRLLEGNQHWNHKLQQAFNRDPNFDFIAVPVEGNTVAEARETALVIEQTDIHENWGNPLLLNLAKDVEAPRTGIKVSDETIEKNRQAAAIQWQDPVKREQASQAAKARWQDPEYRERTVTAQNAGKTAMSDEARAAHRESLSVGQRARYERDGGSSTKGQKRSEEFCAQNSQKISEKWQDPEYRERQRQARIGRENIAVRKQVEVNGVVYPSLTAAAKAHGITKQGALGRIASTKNLDWKYIQS